MQTETLTPQQAKELFLQKLEQDLVSRFTADRLTIGFMTCSQAPSFGWSTDEYNYMPIVASRLREKGYTVSSSVNHGVTDWLISV